MLFSSLKFPPSSVFISSSSSSLRAGSSPFMLLLLLSSCWAFLRLRFSVLYHRFCILPSVAKNPSHRLVLADGSGTPHQGSSYFAMPSLATSIQSLLQLSWPLPASITDDLRVGNPLLAQIDQEFKAVAQDLQIWTFYETIPSRLSGGSVSVSSESRDVYFTAPLTSTKSAILGMRQERVYPLKSDHANVASFGRHNLHTLRLFLKQLAREIDRADANVRDGVDQVNWNLGLEQRVSVEVHGFFDDTPPPVPGQAAQISPIVRTWSTRVPLTSFLNKGPEVCLRERLNEVEVSAEPGVLLRQRGGQSLIRVSDRTDPEVGPPRIRSPHSTTVKNVLGLGTCEGWRPSPASPVIRPVIGPHLKTSLHASSGATLPRTATPPTRTTSPLSHPGLSPSPLVRADFEHDLAIDQLSPPLHSARPFSAGSDGLSSASRDLPPFSDHHRSVLDEACFSDDASLETLPRLPEAVVAVRKVVEDLAGKDDTVIMDGVPRAFKTPSVNTRKFIWVHVPFNNPTWVKVGKPWSVGALRFQMLTQRRASYKPSRCRTKRTTRPCMGRTFG